MRRLITIVVICLFQNTSFAQELRFGAVVGTAPIKHVSLSWSQYSPASTYLTYVESQIGQGLINSYKPFNSVHIGAVINFSYRKFALNIEPQYYFERSVYIFEEPFFLGMDRIIGTKAFRMPTYFTYKFFKKENSSYVLAGLNFTKGKNWDFQHPSEEYYLLGVDPYPDLQDFGDDHFDRVLYDEKGYTSLIIGLGKQFNKFNSSIRFLKPIGSFSKRLPVKTFQFELTFSWLFLSTKEFTKKHPLYFD